MEQRKNIFQIPTTDFSFKKIFGTEQNKRFLIRFLNCFVSKYTGEIVDVTYLPTEQYGMVDTEKKAVFDLLCKDAEDRKFIIEMQKAPQPDYAERSIFYLSRAISASLARGQLDYQILPSYSVNILDFDLQEYRKKDQFFHAVFLKDQNNEILTQKVGIFFIKLCNFAARQSDLTEEMQNWLNVLKNMPDMDESDYEKQPAFFQELLDECRISKLTAMEKDNYQKSVLEYEDVKRAVEYARETAAKVFFEKGMEKGREEGMQQGMEKGREEGMKALLQTVQNLLAKGMSVTEVSEVTGLGVDRIREMADC